METILVDKFDEDLLSELPEDNSAQLREKHLIELKDFGLYKGVHKFEVPNGIAPIGVAIADQNLVWKFGVYPRLVISRVALKDPIFKKVLSDYGLIGKENSGLTLQGWDFEDRKSVKELGSFLIGFENAYRKAKQLAA